MARTLFLDVDGTLVDYHNHLPQSAVAAIRAARAEGHRVYLCTGRSKAEMPENLWDIGIDGMIGGNGSYVEDAGDVVLHQTLTGQECRAIVDWLHAHGLEFYLESNAGLFGSERFEEASAPVLALYSARKGKPVPEGTNSGLHGLVLGEDLFRDDVNKISYILTSYDDHLAAKEQFRGLQHGTWGGRGAEALFGDIGPTGITKAHAVDTLLEHLGADRADTIAFGDATVDISMFEACAVGVAMGNASADLKDIATHVTDDVEEDGLANAFRELGLVGR
ncbi:MAG: Cof-type HAD-IIB family hydrolase [Brooklawnia sp.]|nr:Cof-type HAD-IIB family hydrolase [Brooklawnia sp.]